MDVLEKQLNDFDPIRRNAALDELIARLGEGDITLEPEGDRLNLHCHTFFSYNGYGYSPSYIAWQARKSGWRAAGIVDFDVLDGVDEFLVACRRLGVRGCAGLETRVFIPEFADRVINSPGEPGIAYHMGAGFTASAVRDPELVAGMKAAAQARNQTIIEKVNPHVEPCSITYQRDALPLTPNGNVTERHLCMAYEQRGVQEYPDALARTEFWAQALGVDAEKVAAVLDDSPAMQGLIRSKLMKSGGPGYIKAEAKSFPLMKDVNTFTIEAGGIPCCAWLDGTTEGEQAMDELLDLEMSLGTAALNIIPDRNWNIKDPELKKTKVANLNHVIELARERDLPILVGTEMNAYGLKLIDDFEAPELAPFVPDFVKGAQIMYAHTVLQGHGGLGYLSEWASEHFTTVAEKNDFFAAFGEVLAPELMDGLPALDPSLTPDALLQAAKDA